MQKVFKYIIAFVLTAIIAYMTLVVVAKIPNDKVREHINESTDAFKMNERYKILKNLSEKKYGVRHIYGDAMMANIIWHLDSKDAFKSAVEARFYSMDGNLKIDYNLKELSENNPPNSQYIRYWHGYIVVLKPLLIFFNIEQIYYFNVVLSIGITIYVMVLLWKKNLKEFIIAFIVGSIMCMEIIVPFNLECSFVYWIMVIASILAIKLDKRQKDLRMLFFITGMLTCYFDFLTNEIITLLIPLMIAFIKRCKENRINSFKEAFNFLIKASILWIIGYAGMYVAKWMVASIVLNKSIIDIWNNYVKENLLLRVNGDTYNFSKVRLALEAINRNYTTLFPLDELKNSIIIYFIPIILIIFEIIFINKKEIKKQWKSGILFIISIIPYIRYAVLSNHSYWHRVFTFRTQIVTITAIILGIYYSVDKEIMKKEIKIGILKYGKRTNNIDTSTK